MWKHYIEYLDEIVMDGFFNCIYCSLQYFMENTDKEHQDIPPLLECKLELQAPDMVFDPSIEQVSSLSLSLSHLLQPKVQKGSVNIHVYAKKRAGPGFCV